MEELKLIKKYYGEEFSHFIRDSFPGLLEQEGLLLNLLENHFAHNKELYNDIKEHALKNNFKAYIFGLTSKENNNENTNLTPQELLSKAGYNLYECKTEEEIQKFKKYYVPQEELCTFRGGRLDKCYVFFAVKKDVDKIIRKDFRKPQREDKYGTSVISIQFTRGNKNYLSIKNRYNHTVANPDATFSNNLDNIIKGLTDSFVKKYNFNLQYQLNNFEIPGYVCIDDKYYKYNYEIHGIYFCTNNVIIDHYVIKNHYQDKSRYMFIDYFIIDMQEKSILSYGDLYDGFDKIYNHFKNIKIKKIATGKIVILEYENYSINMTLDKNNCMISLEDTNIKSVIDNYLVYNKYLKYINLPNAEYINSNFLADNKVLENINIPNVIEINNRFLYNNNNLKKLLLPKTKKIGKYAVVNSESLELLYIPNLEVAGESFISRGGILETFDAPKLKQIHSYTLRDNYTLKELNIPNVEIIENDFLKNNYSLREFKAPKLIYIGQSCLEKNDCLDVFSAPNVETIRGYFLKNNINLKELYFPNLEFIGEYSLLYNKSIKSFYAPKLKIICNEVLYDNRKLKNVVFDSNVVLGLDALHNNYLLRLKLYMNKNKNRKILRKKLD